MPLLSADATRLFYAPDRSLRLRFLVRQQRYLLERRRFLFGWSFYREIECFSDAQLAFRALDIEYQAGRQTPGYPRMKDPANGNFDYELATPNPRFV